ncbi:type II toxin-antitoxin system VapC family toxin [Variovorax ureilyticus]|uniref:Type II toxin-antitoxin system VapC family toxin n=1 Tax=Variovorax ureilyticus TaxID=1836198 RepID=A0ABU8VP89_9BURK
MKALIDSNALIDLLDPRTPRSRSDRMKGLLEDIDKSNGKLLIPAQVVGEYIAGAGPAGQPILKALLNNRRIEVVSFDHVAATECALMDRAAVAAGGHKRAPLGRDALWQKVKVDRQIVALAKVHAVDLIVSSDGDIPKLAQAVNIRCTAVKDLALPGWAQQVHIDEIAEPPRPRRTERVKVLEEPVLRAVAPSDGSGAI